MKKSKYEIALEALKYIRDNSQSGTLTHDMACQTYDELTAPRMETVEVEKWVITNIKTGEQLQPATLYDCYQMGISSEYWQNRITINVQRPVEEKEPEVWEGILTTDERGKPYVLFKDTPTGNYNGKNVEVRLKEAE